MSTDLTKQLSSIFSFSPVLDPYSNSDAKARLLASAIGDENSFIARAQKATTIYPINVDTSNKNVSIYSTDGNIKVNNLKIYGDKFVADDGSGKLYTIELRTLGSQNDAYLFSNMIDNADSVVLTQIAPSNKTSENNISSIGEVNYVTKEGHLGASAASIAALGTQINNATIQYPSE